MFKSNIQVKLVYFAARIKEKIIQSLDYITGRFVQAFGRYFSRGLNKSVVNIFNMLVPKF